MNKSEILYEDYKSGDIKSLALSSVILPIGSIEQHGPHACIGTDYILAQHFSKRLSKRTQIPLLPAVAYGCSELHLGHAGTISISKSAFKLYLSDIFESLVKSNIEIVYVINGHGSNIRSIEECAEAYKEQLHVIVINWWMEGRALELFEQEEYHHAGALETSVLLAIDEKYVDRDRMVDTPIVDYDPYTVKNINDLTPVGSIGTVTTASRYRGMEYIEKLEDLLFEKYFEQR